MSDIAKQIFDKLNTMFSESDSKVLEGTKEWAKGRNMDHYGGRTYYQQLFSVAGGKTWYNIFDGRNWQMIEEVIEKDHARTIKARNAKIAKKLDDAGVTEVISEEVAYTNDGFNGIFRVNTDSGVKVIKIESILAGGYNIQCLHHRVLVRVK